MSPNLIRAIESFLRRSGMAESRFGREAAGDPRLVFDMRKGRTLKPSTEAKVRAFIEGWRG